MRGCPLLKMKACVGDKCSWWTEMTVTNTQTKKIEIDKRCAIERLPILLLEQNRNTKGVQAAVESSRNEDIKRKDALLTLVGGQLPSVSQD